MLLFSITQMSYKKIIFQVNRGKAGIDYIFIQQLYKLQFKQTNFDGIIIIILSSYMLVASGGENSELLCRKQHKNAVLNLVCLHPQCIVNPLICSQCANTEHREHKNQIYDVQNFKKQTLKLLSINANSNHQAYLNQLKLSKERVLQKINKMENTMAQLIVKLKLAINNQYQIYIQSFNPKTYLSQLNYLNSGLTQSKVKTTCFKLKVIRQNKFKNNVQLVQDSQQSYDRVLTFVNQKLEIICQYVQKFRQSKDMKLKTNKKVQTKKQEQKQMVQEGEIEQIVLQGENISKIQQKITPLQQNLPSKMQKLPQKISQTVNKQKPAKPQVIQLDSDSSSSSSSSSDQSRSREKRKTYKPKKMNKKQIKNTPLKEARKKQYNQSEKIDQQKKQNQKMRLDKLNWKQLDEKNIKKSPLISNSIDNPPFLICKRSQNGISMKVKQIQQQSKKQIEKLSPHNQTKFKQSVTHIQPNSQKIVEQQKNSIQIIITKPIPKKTQQQNLKSSSISDILEKLNITKNKNLNKQPIKQINEVQNKTNSLNQQKKQSIVNENKQKPTDPRVRKVQQYSNSNSNSKDQSDSKNTSKLNNKDSNNNTSSDNSNNIKNNNNKQSQIKQNQKQSLTSLPPKSPSIQQPKQKQKTLKMPLKKPWQMSPSQVIKWFESSHTAQQMPQYTRVLSHCYRNEEKYYLLYTNIDKNYKWYGQRYLARFLDQEPRIKEYQQCIKRYK